MAEFKVIETQEQFDERIKERIERAEKKIREEFTGWTSPADLQALNEAHAGEISALKDAQAKELEKYAGYDEKFNTQAARIKELETDALKVRIANEKGLPTSAVEFLRGDDEETITDSADKLAKLSGSAHVFGFTRSTEEKTNPTAEAFREMARKYGKN
jgi:hypothetical protein